MKFVRKVSKGTNFNQIYVPKEVSEIFEIGSLVEVKLLKKPTTLCYSKNLKKLSDFKEKLINELFSFLNKFQEIKQMFVVGSFLTEKIEYNDIDVLIILEREDRELEKKIYGELIDKFNLKFHLLFMTKERFILLSEICPLTRSMLYFHVSNKEFSLPKRKVDKRHIKFLMMMPEDLLEIKMESKVFYDNIRRIICIERFLIGKDENPTKINLELKKTVGNEIYEIIKMNNEINDNILKKLREIIQKKINKIGKLIK